MDLEKHSTSISTEQHKPLIVEFKTTHPHVMQTDNTFKREDEYHVALVSPKVPYCEALYLVGMTPGTSLNLLKWLQEHEELLIELAEEKERKHE